MHRDVWDISPFGKPLFLVVSGSTPCADGTTVFLPHFWELIVLKIKQWVRQQWQIGCKRIQSNRKMGSIACCMCRFAREIRAKQCLGGIILTTSAWVGWVPSQQRGSHKANMLRTHKSSQSACASVTSSFGFSLEPHGFLDFLGRRSKIWMQLIITKPSKANRVKDNNVNHPVMGVLVWRFPVSIDSIRAKMVFLLKIIFRKTAGTLNFDGPKQQCRLAFPLHSRADVRQQVNAKIAHLQERWEPHGVSNMWTRT